MEDMKNDNVSLYREIEKVTEDNNFLAEEVIFINNFKYFYVIAFL